MTLYGTSEGCCCCRLLFNRWKLGYSVLIPSLRGVRTEPFRISSSLFFLYNESSTIWGKIYLFVIRCPISPISIILGMSITAAEKECVKSYWITKKENIVNAWCECSRCQLSLNSVFDVHAFCWAFSIHVFTEYWTGNRFINENKYQFGVTIELV